MDKDDGFCYIHEKKNTQKIESQNSIWNARFSSPKCWGKVQKTREG